MYWGLYGSATPELALKAGTILVWSALAQRLTVKLFNLIGCDWP